MRHPWIQTGLNPTLPPRRVCASAVAKCRPATTKPMCCACSVECDPDGELRLDMIFEDGKTDSRLVTPEATAAQDRAPSPGELPMISALISRWIRWRC
jgi:hypothetical protein